MTLLRKIDNLDCEDIQVSMSFLLEMASRSIGSALSYQGLELETFNLGLQTSGLRQASSWSSTSPYRRLRRVEADPTASKLAPASSERSAFGWSSYAAIVYLVQVGRARIGLVQRGPGPILAFC